MADIATPIAGGSAVEGLRARLRGELIQPADEGYADARKLWNGLIDKRPALIVRASGTADVIAAVNFAREQDLPLAVRGGGHNVAGTASVDGGLVIDLSQMRGVRVDPTRKTVRAGGGATLGDIDHETQAFDLAVPVGVVSRTGIGGLSLHGGMGLLTRKYGLTSDNLLSADVVTADGQLRVASEDEHPELFWALKGGGGNFGVVTSFEFRLHPIGPEVFLALVMYPVAEAPRVLVFFREFMAQAPDEIMAIALLWNAPTDEPIPPEHRGKPIVALAACYAGPPEEGEGAVKPFRELHEPVADLSGSIPYKMAQSLFDSDYPDGRRYYWKSTYLSHLDDEVIVALVEHAERRPSPLTSLDVWALGGAFSRVPPTEAAFARRDAPFLLGIEANWIDLAEDGANVAWAREVFRDMQRFSPGGVYLNFPGFGEEKEALVRAAYGRNYDRLAQVKRRYDPTNLFRSNINIAP
jgi:FAD/FMN-containing dehydrogenase